MKFLVSLIVVLFSLNTQAYIPTIESLFRNGGNESIDGTTVRAYFRLKRENSVAQSSETLEELPSVHSYQLLYNTEAKRSSQMIQVSYNGTQFSKSSMFDLKYFSQTKLNSFKITNEDIEKKLFYSIMNSLLINDGSMMVSFLNSVGLSALRNTERVNRDQMQLISKYISFLKAKKENPDAELENPLEPENEEVRAEVQKTLNSPFLTKSPYVKRIVQDGKVFFIVENENVKIKFDGQDHELMNMTVKTESGTINIRCLNYIAFSTVNKNLKFPQIVLLKDLEGNEYELKMEKLNAFPETTDSFLRRYNSYKDDLKTGLNQEILGKSPFIL